MNPSTADYIQTLISEFERERNPENAAQQKAYMRNQFEFIGLTATQRRALSKPFLAKDHLPTKAKAFQISRELWTQDEREYQLFSMDLLLKYNRKLDREDLAHLEHFITHKSWWDTVDMLAYKLVGAYMLKFPEAQKPKVDQWLASDNLWLQRTAILFQLQYKEQLDTELLTHAIHAMLGSKEFFINKAIGWVLRQYSRTHPEWVKEFVAQTELHALSRKEDLRLLK